MVLPTCSTRSDFQEMGLPMNCEESKWGGWKGLWMAGAVLAGLALLLAAYVDSAAPVPEIPAPPVEVQPQTPSTAVSLQVGQQRTIMLHSNAGTGFIWQLAEPLPAGAPVSALLTGVEHDESNCCGFPVPITLSITALKPGKVTLRLIYVRPWEQDRAPAKQEIFNIEVKNPGN